MFLECKDWTSPVDIPTIDALHSKSLDVGADLTIIYSNSGFSKKALAKARRVGIGAMSALAAGEKRIRYTVEQFCVARAIIVDSWSLSLFLTEACANSFPSSWQTCDLLYKGLPVQNWLADLSKRLLLQNFNAQKLSWTATFKSEVNFEMAERVVTVLGARIDLLCKHKYVCQVIRHDVTKGAYDHIRQAVLVPFSQPHTFGPIDMHGWEDYNGPLLDLPSPSENEMRIDMVVSQAIPLVSDEDKPDISVLFDPSDQTIEVE